MAVHGRLRAVYTVLGGRVRSPTAVCTVRTCRERLCTGAVSTAVYRYTTVYTVFGLWTDHVHGAWTPVSCADRVYGGVRVMLSRVRGPYTS